MPFPREPRLTAPVQTLEVLVTGASSQIGCAALPRLHALGHRVHALSRHPQEATDPRTHWHRVDLDAGWPTGLPDVFDVVLSFGPMQALADAWSALSAAPCRRLVAISSMSAESKRSSPVPVDRALADALRTAESALVAQCERLGIGWTLLRPTMIYGMGHDRNLTPIARRAIRWRVCPYPRGLGLRQPVHAEDVAEAAWRAAIHGDAVGQVFEIGGGERLRIDRMFRRLHRSLPVRSLSLPVPRIALRILAALRPAWRGAVSRIDQDLLADNARVRAVLGIEPRGFRPTAGTWRRGPCR